MSLKIRRMRSASRNAFDLRRLRNARRGAVALATVTALYAAGVVAAGEEEREGWVRSAFGAEASAAAEERDEFLWRDAGGEYEALHLVAAE